MKIAIPVFGSKISPRFDSAQDFILLQVERSNVLKRENLPTRDWSPSAKLKQMVDLKVDTLICGGIDLDSLQRLKFSGIDVYSWITGAVEDVITCFLERGLESGIILGARGKRKGKWRFCNAATHACNLSQSGSNRLKGEVTNMPKRNEKRLAIRDVKAGKDSGCSRKNAKANGSVGGRNRGAGCCQARRPREGGLDKEQ